MLLPRLCLGGNCPDWPELAADIQPCLTTTRLPARVRSCSPLAVLELREHALTGRRHGQRVEQALHAAELGIEPPPHGWRQRADVVGADGLEGRLEAVDAGDGHHAVLRLPRAPRSPGCGPIMIPSLRR